jgi:hypothetical protein
LRGSSQSAVVLRFYLSTRVRAFRPAKLGAWIPLRPSAFSPSRQCLCATRWRDVVIGSCCCSPFRALSGLSTASFRELGHLAWSRQSGQWSPCGAGSRRHISDFCIDPRLLAERPPLLDEPRSRSRPAHHAFKRLSQRTNETPERATSGASLSCARPRGRLRSNPALIAACFFSAQTCLGVRLIPKTDHERFRFGGNREPQFMRTLMIGHRGNSHFARCRH